MLAEPPEHLEALGRRSPSAWPGGSGLSAPACLPALVADAFVQTRLDPYWGRIVRAASTSAIWPSDVICRGPIRPEPQWARRVSSRCIRSGAGFGDPIRHRLCKPCLPCPSPPSIRLPASFESAHQVDVLPAGHRGQSVCMGTALWRAFGPICLRAGAPIQGTGNPVGAASGLYRPARLPLAQRVLPSPSMKTWRAGCATSCCAAGARAGASGHSKHHRPRRGSGST